MQRPFGRRSRVLGAAALSLIAGCATYEASPLDADDILISIEQTRREGLTAGRVDLATATAWAHERSPRLRELHVAAETAGELADLPTPLPNPTVSAGPILSSGADVTSSSRWGVEVVAGWLLDLSGGRAAASDMRRAVSRAKQVEFLAATRTNYLEIRRAFTALEATRRTRESLEESEDIASAAVHTAHRLVEAAAATTLDVREFEVDARRAAADLHVARSAEDDARVALAMLTGVHASVFESVEPAEPLPSPPDRDGLVRAMLAGHPDLDALRARYAVAEAELAAELTARFPGIELEPGWEREDDTDRYSLGVGWELPIFDRNELAIIAAAGRRSQVRAQFEAEVADRLTSLDAALTRLAHQSARLEQLRTYAEPAADDALRLAADGLRNGVVDGLRYLDAARSHRAVRLDVIHAESDLLAAWCDLEAACGVPLLRFPSMTASAAHEPRLPQGDDQ